MTLNISLSPESEAALQERAAASGMDVVAFVRETIEEKLFAAPNSDSASGTPGQGSVEWFARLNEWVAGHPARQFLAEDGRDAIYNEEPD
ncbi:MAG TPA: hypothetical protein VFC78_21590 [Tepidisphaeraceae bacterium]|nr:hypothetical protein [Tepidisphaeraceae bacterium]